MILRAIAVLSVLVPAGALRAAEPPRDNRPGAPYRGYHGDRPDRGPRNPAAEEPIDWNQVQKFMQANAPNRWAAYQKLPEEQKLKLRGLLIGRYRAIQRLEREGSRELIQIKEKQIRLEDELFRLNQERKAPGANAEKIVAEMREKTRQWVETRFLEREERLRRLKAIVEEETKRLQEDRANIDQLINSRLEEELDEADDVRLPGNPRFGRPSVKLHPATPPPGEPRKPGD